jgi:hypothetical protein
MPANWPPYDIIAQPKGNNLPQRISVKSRTFKKGSSTYVVYDSRNQFEWLAIVFLPGEWATRSKSFHPSKGTCCQLTLSGVAVEKLTLLKFAEISLR